MKSVITILLIKPSYYKIMFSELANLEAFSKTFL